MKDDKIQFNQFILDNREKYFGDFLKVLEHSYNNRYWYFVKINELRAECFLIGVYTMIYNSCGFNRETTTELMYNLMRKSEIIPPHESYSDFSKTISNKYLLLGAKKFFSKKVKFFFDECDQMFVLFEKDFKNNISKELEDENVGVTEEDKKKFEIAINETFVLQNESILINKLIPINQRVNNYDDEYSLGFIYGFHLLSISEDFSHDEFWGLVQSAYKTIYQTETDEKLIELCVK